MVRLGGQGRIDRGRLGAAVLAVAVQAAIGWALLSGLAVRFGGAADETLKLFGVAPPPPPRPPAPPPRATVRSPEREGRAAPPNIRSRATELVAPVPAVPPPTPVPIVAAPVANTGTEATQGAAPVIGPGTGAGGVGDGTGSGGSGDGGGAGGEGESFEPLGGEAEYRDLPRAVRDRGRGGVVAMAWTVGTDGRVHDCVVTRSSGDPELDQGTCASITKRLRYRPSLDARGRPVPDRARGEQVWDWRMDE